MDEYDLRRLWAFKSKTIRLSSDELEALVAMDPDISDEDLQGIADPASVSRDRLIEIRASARR